jgi:uncharacterized SAM-binding protein YcdF (DUF218 family)
MLRLQRGTSQRVVVAALVVLIGAAAALPAPRTAVLRTAGRLLVAEDPLNPVDVIVVTVAGGAAGMLEATELVHQGIARRVAVFTDPPNDVEREFMRRGVEFENRASTSARLLKSLGVDSAERIPKSIDGTEEEARVLPTWARSHAVHSVMVITTPDHSRRLRRVFLREMAGFTTTVTVRSTRYSPFNPDRWWQTRDGSRTALVELQKLLLDFALHPLS